MYICRLLAERSKSIVIPLELQSFKVVEFISVKVNLHEIIEPSYTTGYNNIRLYSPWCCMTFASRVQSLAPRMYKAPRMYNPTISRFLRNTASNDVWT